MTPPSSHTDSPRRLRKAAERDARQEASLDLNDAAGQLVNERYDTILSALVTAFPGDSKKELEKLAISMAQQNRRQRRGNHTFK